VQGVRRVPLVVVFHWWRWLWLVDSSIGGGRCTVLLVVVGGGSTGGA